MSTPQNIWIINHYAMPPQYEVRVRTNVMAKYLKKWGYKVKIFSASTIHNTSINLIEDKKKLFIERSYDDLDFIHIKTSNYTGNGFSRILNMLQFPLRFYRVSSKINFPPDIVICDLAAIFAVIPYWVSKRFRAKFVLEVRDLWPESIVEYMRLSRKNPIVWFMYKLEKFMYKKADIIIFTMEGGKDYIIDKGWDKDIDMSKIYHINNGVDLEVFNHNKEHYKIDDQDLENKNIFKVIYAGSIRLANNIKKIVDTAQIIQDKGYSDIKFLIYGNGPDRAYLEKYCLKNKINNIVFKGFVEKNKIPYILSRGNLNILHFEQNSLKKYGASLNKMFEYFASGKPTVSDCEFGYDIIRRYNCGIVTDNANPEQLAKDIISFYSMSKEDYEIYCKNALKAARNYDYKILIKKLKEVILKD
ncbi:MAG: glycosyltransferase family 4 protein [Firmicutes bacterium]|nr:glycosyltransferase family 4 protein [Bacillota bacterium]